MKKSNRDELEDLYVELTKEFSRRIREGTATPSDLNAARAFLKDNGITSDTTVQSNPIMNLLHDLPFAENE